MSEHTTTETVTREVSTDAPVEPQETAEAVTDVIAAQSAASVEQIEAAAEADVARIEAAREESEWRTSIQAQMTALQTEVSSIRETLQQTPVLTVQALPGTQTNTPPDQTADPSTVQTEVSAPAVAAVVAVEQPPAANVRRAPVVQRRERYL